MICYYWCMKADITSPKILREVFSRLFDEAPVSIIIIDKKGKILAVNKGFSSFTNKDPDEMVGRSLLGTREIKNPKLAKKYRDLIFRGRPFFDQPFRHYSELQDCWYTMLLSAVPLKNPDGKIWGAISMARDVTDLALAQSRLKASNAELQKKISHAALKLTGAEKQLKKQLDLRSQFFADASHELRTPLTIIKGNLDLFKLKGQDISLPEKIQESFSNINQEVDRITELLSDITFLNYADSLAGSGTAGHLQPVDLTQLLKETLTGFKTSAAFKKISLKAKLSPVLVLGGETRLKKLAENLIANALRYTNSGGKVEVGLYRQGAYAVLEVKDTGIGIGKKYLPHIFERFYRANKERSRAMGGSGLGLAIVKEIINQHKGKISVKSAPGKGTVFTVKLPVK